jgi:cytochrome P450
MATTLFLQSEEQNPYKIYETMLKENPVFWDSSNNLWGIYSYQDCIAILSNPLAHIPSTNPDNKDGLNEYSLLITCKLARLSNGARHEMAKHATMLLFENMNEIATNDIIKTLVEKQNNKSEMDWVNSICKKLPLMAILKSFGFKEDDSDFILSQSEQLVKIMLPNKTPEEISEINKIAEEIYMITEKYLVATKFYKPLRDSISEKYKTGCSETTSLFVSNLIGLLIQSYDAGRGILSNSLLQIINNTNVSMKNSVNKNSLEKCVIETLRFDPPVHNTRRIASGDILTGNIHIKKGQTIFIVLAAANRDSHKFKNPGVFNVGRANNAEHLTFGVAGHRCPANRFIVCLATEALSYFFCQYKTIQLVEKDIIYEPTINTRLPKHIFISMS